MTLWQENLRRLIALVGEKIEVHNEACGKFNHNDYAAWRERCRVADRELKAFFIQEADARFTHPRGDEHAVRMAGIRSTATGGWASALGNWKRAAEKKLMLADLREERR